MLKPLILAALVASCSPVMAQNARNCGERDTVMQRLADSYGETRQSIGIGANNAFVEVMANTETGSWTITVTAAGGLTCLMASGQAFEVLEEALPSKEPNL